MTNIKKFNQALALGFEDIERALESAARLQSDGYPPYNIERSLVPEKGAEHLRIVLAVAGFTRDLLEVRREGQQLTIKGKKAESRQDNLLHKGIALRQFQRTFILADHLEIKGATLRDGLLTITLSWPEPSAISEVIEIL